MLCNNRTCRLAAGLVSLLLALTVWAGQSCPKCKTESADDARFCRECGSTLSLSCPKCNAKCAKGDRFCGGCGGPLVQASRSLNTAPAKRVTGVKFVYERSRLGGGNEYGSEKCQVAIDGRNLLSLEFPESSGGDRFEQVVPLAPGVHELLMTKQTQGNVLYSVVTETFKAFSAPRIDLMRFGVARGAVTEFRLVRLKTGKYRACIDGQERRFAVRGGKHGAEESWIWFKEEEWVVRCKTTNSWLNRVFFRR